MEAIEIRKGVYLKWKDNKQEFDVDLGLMLDKYFWNHIENKDIIPIPLTEQWLKDLGFNINKAWKEITLWESKGNKCSLSYSNGACVFSQTMKQGFDMKQTLDILQKSDADPKIGLDNLYIPMKDNKVVLQSIKYVHQLQNLYFALTGNELTK